VRPGDAFGVEMLDWAGGQIGNNDSADHIRDVELEQAELPRRGRRRTGRPPTPRVSADTTAIRSASLQAP
jgi:hypothetical protein